MTFRGGHTEPPNQTYKPNIASEFKRRFDWAMFTLDNGVASFTGRPPQLSRHYISTPLPLDLKDDYLFQDEKVLARAVAETLDSKGWNTEGRMYYSTLIRARSMLGVITDEIFELVLGRNTSTCSVDYIL
jgi:hypothetical protein